MECVGGEGVVGCLARGYGLGRGGQECEVRGEGLMLWDVVLGGGISGCFIAGCGRE